MLNKIFPVLLASFLMTGTVAKAQQDITLLRSIEDSLVKVVDSMYETKIPDEMPEFNAKIVRQLVRALKIDGSFNYGFDSLAKRLNIIYPEDKSFRIFNWAIAPEENIRRYYGAVQMNSDKLKLYPLVDCSADLTKGAEDSVLQGGKWFGALYYKILTRDVDGQTMYTILGVNGASPIVTRKLMDPMVITEKGPVFGAPIFNIRSQNNPDQRIKRFIIEYKKQVQASMNWDDEGKYIYFDHLESETNDPNRKYTYVPSGQYDGFRWVDGYWNFIPDLIPVDQLKDGAAPVPQPYKGREN